MFEGTSVLRKKEGRYNNLYNLSSEIGKLQILFYIRRNECKLGTVVNQVMKFNMGKYISL